MDRSEWLHRAGTLVMIVGGIALAFWQLSPFDLGQRRAIGFGVFLGLTLRALYTLSRYGWDAANNEADRDGIFLVLSIILIAILAMPF